MSLKCDLEESAEMMAEYDIGYLDVVSLYPFTNYSTAYPIGHPRLVIPTQQVLEEPWTRPEHNEYRGLIKVSSERI